MLFFYPADFTFICPTEVTGFSKAGKEFAAEDALVWHGLTKPKTVQGKG